MGKKGGAKRKLENPFSLQLSDFKKARHALKKILKDTPLVFNSWLSEAMGCEVYLKLENMQPIGSFKIRGATYKILRLTPREKKQGIIAASAGNHAQGVAWGARYLGVNALIVMPQTAPQVKYENTLKLGAQVIQHGKNYDEAYEEATRHMKTGKRVFVHAFDDADVITGQGTLGLEILEQLPDVDVIIGSVGGGGMMAGVALAVKALCPKVKIVAGQSEGAASMIQSILKNKAVTLQSTRTFADGIAVKQCNDKLRKTLDPVIDEWVAVEEESIRMALRKLVEKARVVTEGAGAVPMAVLEKIKSHVQGKKVVLILSGGNIDSKLLCEILKS